MILRFSIGILALSFALNGFAKEREGSKGSSQEGLDVMFYNVLNLFDAEHDEGKDDWTFLPKGFPGKVEYCKTVSNPKYREECEKSDWTPKHVELKLKQIKKAIFANRTKLPAMLGLCEVENENVVGQLGDVLGYKGLAMANSPDTRGIDVGLLYNETDELKFVNKKEYTVTAEGLKATRNILEVQFEYQGEQLFVYVNHWPSQAAPAVMRVAAAKILQEAIDSRITKNKDALVIAMGDFNTVPQDYPHPFKTVLTSSSAANQLVDVRDAFQSNKEIPVEKKKAQAFGTYFFARDMTWNFLDHFFVSKSLVDGNGADVALDSFDINAYAPVVQDFKYEDQSSFAFGTLIKNAPRDYNLYTLNEDEAGFSDHFGISMTLIRKK